MAPECSVGVASVRVVMRNHAVTMEDEQELVRDLSNGASDHSKTRHYATFNISEMVGL